MNGSVHDPHAHKRTSINELLNPVTSSAIDHGLPHQPPSYPNGHYAQNATYPMPPPPHHRVANGTAYKLNPASWDGADHDRQRLDHMSPQRGYAPGAVPPPGAYPEFHPHVPRTHEDGLSEPSVWPSPSGRLEAGYGSPSYSDERTCKYISYSRTLLSIVFSPPAMPNDASTTATSSPYPSRPDSATYHRPDLAPVAYSPRPPQAPAGKAPISCLLSHLTFF